MTDQSTNLELPFLLPAQAQKHLTVNEALLRLDAVVQLSVVSATTTAQPTAPADGAIYIVPAGKTGAQWSAMADQALAYWRDGAWEAIAPREGWLAFVRDTDQLRVYDGAAWSQSALRAGLGLGTMATQAAAAYAPLTGATFTGDLALNGANVAMSGAFPLFGFYETDAPANSRRYWLYANNSAFNIELVDDGITASQTVLSLPRSANELNGMDVRAPVWPMTDNSFALGAAGQRWSVVYAATGAINTSDARDKTGFSPIPESAKRAMRRVVSAIGVFQWLDAVALKGESAARLHIGITAQTVRDAFAAEGEDPTRWALFCEDAVLPDAPDDADDRQLTRMGVGADQLMWLALATLTSPDSAAPHSAATALCIEA